MMSEKRFEVIDNSFSMWIVDTTLKEDRHEGNIYTAYDMCHKLNEFCEENEKLRKENKNLQEEIEELKRERDSWKSSTCNYMNKDSVLSMDCQIVHEALFELERLIEADTEQMERFNDLKDKFEKLNNHRIGVF